MVKYLLFAIAILNIVMIVNYLCIACNEVQPAVSKRIIFNVVNAPKPYFTIMAKYNRFAMTISKYCYDRKSLVYCPQNLPKPYFTIMEKYPLFAIAISKY